MQIFAYFSPFLACITTFEWSLWCAFVLELIFLSLICVFVSKEKRKRKGYY